MERLWKQCYFAGGYYDSDGTTVAKWLNELEKEGWRVQQTHGIPMHKGALVLVLCERETLR